MSTDDPAFHYEGIEAGLYRKRDYADTTVIGYLAGLLPTFNREFATIPLARQLCIARLGQFMLAANIAARQHCQYRQSRLVTR